MLISTVNAQNVKFKKGKVLINEKEVFSYREGNTSRGETISIYNITTNEEVIFIKADDCGTRAISDNNVDWEKDDYITYNFLKEKVKVEMHGYTNFKGNIAFLFQQGVFDLKGILNPEKIALFKEKYDEKISEKTTIIK